MRVFETVGEDHNLQHQRSLKLEQFGNNQKRNWLLYPLFILFIHFPLFSALRLLVCLLNGSTKCVCVRAEGEGVGQELGHTLPLPCGACFALLFSSFHRGNREPMDSLETE